MMTPEEAREASIFSQNEIQAFRKKQALAAAEAAIALSVLEGRFCTSIFIHSDIESAMAWLETELRERGYVAKRREGSNRTPALIISW